MDAPNAPHTHERTAQAVRALPIAEAATRLGIKPGALRMRLLRGQVAGYKRGRAWFVAWPVAGDNSNLEIADEGSAPSARTAPHVRAPHALNAQPVRDAGGELAVLRETVVDLRRRLDHSERAQDELRQLLAAAISTVRQLPEATTAPAPPAAPDAQSPHPAPESPQRGAQPRIGAFGALWHWWRRATT